MNTASVEEPIDSQAPLPVLDGLPGGAERRRAARQTLVTKAMLYGDAGAPVQPRRVFLCNISHFGIGFHAPVSFEAGQRYRMKLEAGPMRLSSHLEVVSCRPKDEQTFEVGAEFVRNEVSFDEPPARRTDSIPRNPSRELIPQT